MRIIQAIHSFSVSDDVEIDSDLFEEILKNSLGKIVDMIYENKAYEIEETIPKRDNYKEYVVTVNVAIKD